jgi:hypothetical protein
MCHLIYRWPVEKDDIFYWFLVPFGTAKDVSGSITHICAKIYRYCGKGVGHFFIETAQTREKVTGEG